VRWDNNQDTPLPPEVPQGQNPPDGIAIDYFLKAATPGVKIEVRDAAGALLREWNDDEPRPDPRMPNVPAYWFKRYERTEAGAGMHRLVWDLRYPTPPPLDFNANGDAADTVSFGIIAPAVIGQTSKQQPIGSLVLPGRYQVRLIAGAQTLERTITVTNDPRSDATMADLAAQFAQEKRLMSGIDATSAAMNAVSTWRAKARSAASDKPALADALQTFDRAAAGVMSALAANRGFASMLPDLQFADQKPAASVVSAIDALCTRGDQAIARSAQFVAQDVVAFNTALKNAGVTPIASTMTVPATACGGR
jgi:hypothetical protein